MYIVYYVHVYNVRFMVYVYIIYIQFDSQQSENVKSGVIEYLMNRAIMVCTNEKLRDAALNRIKETMMSNRYRLKLKEKVWQRQIKQCSMQQRQEQEQDGEDFENEPYSPHSGHKLHLQDTVNTERPVHCEGQSRQ